MTYRFGSFELDPAKFELRRDGEALAAEPQVISLVLLLVENADRLISKDEIIDTVWKGRFVSDSAVTSRIKTARQLLGDDGKQQKYIKTVHGKGFRFVAEIAENSVVTSQISAEILPVREVPSSRPSIAVLPFRLIGVAGDYAPIAEALPHEIITELSRLRWLFVIARESSFQFHSRASDMAKMSETLGVNYYLSGTVEIIGDNMAVTVELADTRDGGVLWAERYSSTVDGVHDIRQKIIASIIIALELEIPQNEARNARVASPKHLDAWANYHLGLEHMYRFTRDDNIRAMELFKQAAATEPDFARAHAGIAFVHCTNVTSQLTKDMEAAVKGAMHHAQEALVCDPRDPFANVTMGRALWLTGDMEGSRDRADRSVKQSPNYAQGYYARAWPENALGMMDAALESIDQAIMLSPIDPMASVMRLVRATSHFLLGEKDDAAQWAERASIEPGANGATWAISAAYLEDAGKRAQAERWAAYAHEFLPGATSADLLRSIILPDENAKQRFTSALAKHGI